MNEKAFEKTRIAPMNGEDWKNYVAHVTGADEIYFQYGEEASDELIGCIREPTEGVLYYSIISKDTNAMTGYVGITLENSNVEFYIFKEYRRRGYASEALAGFINAYMDGEITGKAEESVIAETLSVNAASIGLLEKLGFQKQAIGFRVNFEEGDHPMAFLRRYIIFNA